MLELFRRRAGVDVLVAVVGINGIGNEYIRELEDMEVPYILVDFEKILEEHLHYDAGDGGWKVENIYPGHSFEVNLTSLFRGTLSADSGAPALAQWLWARGVTHVIHATPPQAEGRVLFERMMLAADGAVHHLVEKPYWSTYAEEKVSVGYLYKHLDIHATQSVRICAPFSPGWRGSLGDSALLWDMAGHALSVINENDWDSLHVIEESGSVIKLIGSVTVEVAYEQSTSQIFVDDEPLDWDGAFHRQVQAFLQNEDHEAYSTWALSLERELVRLEGEINGIRLAGGAATAQRHVG